MRSTTSYPRSGYSDRLKFALPVDGLKPPAPEADTPGAGCKNAGRQSSSLNHHHLPGKGKPFRNRIGVILIGKRLRRHPVEIASRCEVGSVEFALLLPVIQERLIIQGRHFLAKDIVDLQRHRRKGGKAELDRRPRVERIRIIL